NSQQVQVKAQNVEMPRVAAVRNRLGKGQFFHVAKRLIIKLCVMRALFNKQLQFAQLMDSDGSLNVSEVVLETVFKHLIVPTALFSIPIPSVFANSVQGKYFDAPGQGITVSNPRAAFPSGQILGGIKTESH